MLVFDCVIHLRYHVEVFAVFRARPSELAAIGLTVAFFFRRGEESCGPERAATVGTDEVTIMLLHEFTNPNQFIAHFFPSLFSRSGCL